MATIYFTNEQGRTFADAWARATGGDAIAPDPDYEWESDEIVVELLTPLVAKNCAVTIDGGTRRIEINAPEGFVDPSENAPSASYTFRKCDFIGAPPFGGVVEVETSAEEPATETATETRVGPILGALTFESCLFAVECSDKPAVAIQGDLTVRSCVARNATKDEMEDEALYCDRFFEATSVLIEGSSLFSPEGQESGFNLSYLDPAWDSVPDPENEGPSLPNLWGPNADVLFVDAPTNADRLTSGRDLRQVVGSPRARGANLTGVDFLGNPRKANGALGAFEGTWFVVKDGETKTVSEDLTADYIDVEDGATVVFEGRERVLTALRAAKIGAATFEAATNSTGVFYAPRGTDASAATLTGVRFFARGVSPNATTYKELSVDVPVGYLTTREAIGYLN